ncbi:nitroreductase/quinone reductase family protein [Streptomyces sp. T-3]|nr:nitroreductase/quinone reductase family protein [Streptomyces sp. T-3]
MPTHGRLRLTTTDAESGAKRTTDLDYAHRDGRLTVAAPGPGSPDWHRELLDHPIVEVRLDEQQLELIAVPAEDGRTVALERAPGEDGPAPAEIRTLADKILEIHAWLRAQLAHVHAETEAHFASPGGHRAPLGLQIRQHCLAFCETLSHHHRGEDAGVFPAVAQHHPHLRETLDRLTEEHRTVARIKEELASLLSDFTTADPQRFRTELARMSKELTAHLDYEEEWLLPVLAEVPFPPGR